MLSWFLILLGILFWWLIGRRNRRILRQIAKEFPTDITPLPLLGHSYLYLGNDIEGGWSTVQSNEFAPEVWAGCHQTWRYYGHLACQRVIRVADPEVGDILLKSCLAKDENTISSHRVITGNGSIFAPVNIWRPRRKILAPVFSLKNLNGFVEIFVRQSAIMVELLRSMVGAEDFSIWKYITTYTFDAVSESNLGVDMNSQKKDYHPFLKAFDKATYYVSARTCQPWLYSDLVYYLHPSYWKCRRYTKYLDDFVDEIVKEKRRTLSANAYIKYENTSGIKSRPRTFLEMIIESSGGDKGYNDVELREETKVILMAGTDTSAVGTCFTLLLLARHPDVQETVYKELHEIFGNSDRKLAVEDLPNMKYLEAVIKESLRLYPPVPVISREIHNDVRLPTGTTLVKGVRIFMNIWAMHRNHRYWGEDADRFRPERFLEGPLKHPAQFIPFSYGMRNCLGYQYAMMSMKTALASLLRSYQILPPIGLKPEHYQDPLRVKYNVMTRDVDNFVVRLEKRT